VRAPRAVLNLVGVGRLHLEFSIADPLREESAARRFPRHVYGWSDRGHPRRDRLGDRTDALAHGSQLSGRERAVAAPDRRARPNRTATPASRPERRLLNVVEEDWRFASGISVPRVFVT